MRYLDHFPKPFLEDLVNGNCIPFIGAGFSKNADIPDGFSMPLWDDLGKELAELIPDYAYSGAVDALSAFEYEYSRAKLVEKLTELLLVNKVKPGSAHKAFCEIPFEIVITTNLEFLLERGYDATHRYCCPIVEEDRLAVTIGNIGVNLIKIHGDLHHPKHLIVTEDDYDLFIERYPLYSTYLANLLISKTALFIGYSLDDPDMRHIWQVVGERLGKLRRLAYTIMVNAKPHVVTRFERRGIKVINLPGKESEYKVILERVFIELKEYWEKQLLRTSVVVEETLKQELILPTSSNRLCYFSVPSHLLSFYRTYIFPLVEEQGLTPITSDEIISPADTISAKISALIERASFFVIDISTEYTQRELNIILSRKVKSDRILIISDNSYPSNFEISEQMVLHRPKDVLNNNEVFRNAIISWIQRQSEEVAPKIFDEARRLVALGEYRAALVAIVTLFESHLRKNILIMIPDSTRNRSLLQLVELAISQGSLSAKDGTFIRETLTLRNKIVHAIEQNITQQQATKIVNRFYSIIENSLDK